MNRREANKVAISEARKQKCILLVSDSDIKIGMTANAFVQAVVRPGISQQSTECLLVLDYEHLSAIGAEIVERYFESDAPVFKHTMQVVRNGYIYIDTVTLQVHKFKLNGTPHVMFSLVGEQLPASITFVSTPHNQ